MKMVENVVATLVVIAILAGLAYGIWGMIQLWDLYGLLSPQTRLIVLTGGAVLIIGALIIAGGVRAAVRTLVKGRLNDRRLVVYSEILARYAENGGLPEHKAEVAELGSGKDTVTTLTAEFTLLASPSVLAANEKVVEVLRDSRDHQDGLNDPMRNLIKAMRRELGHHVGEEELGLSWISRKDTAGAAHSKSGLTARTSFVPPRGTEHRH